MSKTFGKCALRLRAPTMAAHTLFSLRRLALASLLVAGVAHAEPPPSTSTISAHVGPLRTNKGSLACRLHASEDGFPRIATGTVSQRVKITGSSARCVFENVTAGSYAVVVHHDENDNRQFDKNILGIPVEGYGVSNNRTHALKAPTWHESKFEVEGGKGRALAISLRY
jgi:uncharacterized protein (DUF2141 family)